ncbi:hypothetical protein RMB03_00570 [Acinetobacter sp. V91_7]|uniref:hypothetical protein n=1 Tax=unclassified Acinetobacter TaxID=196816 RepID=UPI00287DE07E|nr:MULTISPECIES: hypothetical protein [unclassified Acinetobacter]MDS7927896.1 hypothetical protein [Acinetobacter sp. V102_4]MDS7932484.1 hypothetical protein [Acinetobacter sp. V91_4B]MDS7961455.1 hypothetical protein [Acinetobacter sp. V91_7]MDS8025964.1 hypothetical protein [Acinetobacter sp. V91_13]
MLKISALALLGASVVYYAFINLSRPEKKSKMTILISEVEQSMTDAQKSVENADRSLSKIKLKQLTDSEIQN